MGYKPHAKTPKRANREYGKALREKAKNRKHIHGRVGGPSREEKHTATEREISDGTLKRLHTLGNQSLVLRPSASTLNVGLQT